jgi:hypothetical protein
MLVLFLYEDGAPRPRGLAFFWLATSSRSEVNVGSADGPKGEAAGRIKESKPRKADDGVGSGCYWDATQCFQ